MFVCNPHLARLVSVARALVAAGCLLGAGAFGCARLNLQLVDASVRRPSNVAVYFTVDNQKGEGVANLTPQDFHIYEDNQPVSILESKQTILQPEVAAIHYTLLLVDTSGSVVDSGDMPAVIQAASSFSDRVGPYQKIAIYTFDGSPHITPIIGFGGNVRSGINALSTRRPRDPSTNLNGAVIESIRALNHQMNAAPVPLRFGTLVVFTDGTDRAHRASAEDVDKALDGAGFESYVIGVGGEIDKGQLSKVGRSGTFASANRADIQKGFDEIAARIEASSKRFYLLSYCSPARAGQHQVQIEAVANGARGRLSYNFNAAGFGPNCDPNQKPSFDTKNPRLRPPRTQAAPGPMSPSRPPPQAGPPPQPMFQPKR